MLSTCHSMYNSSMQLFLSQLLVKTAWKQPIQSGIHVPSGTWSMIAEQGSEAREAVALTAFQPQDMASRHHQPLPHHSPAQNKRQRLAPPHSLHRQQHPPLPAIPVNNRQPLPAIPEMASRSMHHGHRSRMHHSQAPGSSFSVTFSVQIAHISVQCYSVIQCASPMYCMSMT